MEQKWILEDLCISLQEESDLKFQLERIDPYTNGVELFETFYKPRGKHSEIIERELRKSKNRKPGSSIQ